MGELAWADTVWTVSLSMWTLWMDGTIMNNLDDRLWDLEGRTSGPLSGFLPLFQLQPTILPTNMPIGAGGEVVTA